MKKSGVALLSLFLFSQVGHTGPSISVGVPNPASSTCAKLGGTSETLHESAGEFSLCEFGHAGIEQWTLRSNWQGQETKAVKELLSKKDRRTPINPGPAIGLANPSAVYCLQVGGESMVVTDKDQNQLSVCKFDDHSVIETWTLYAGPSSERNAKLIEVLKLREK